VSDSAFESPQKSDGTGSGVAQTSPSSPTSPAGGARRNSNAGKSAVSTLVRAPSSSSQDGKWSRKGFQRFVDGPFDRVCSAVIVMNVLFVFVELQHSGYLRGVALGYSQAGQWPADSGPRFLLVEHIFNAFFLVELIIRVAAFREKFVYDHGGQGEACALSGVQKANWFDTVLVVSSSIDLYLAKEGEGGVSLTVLRPFRFLRLLRTLRVLQTVRIFEKLKVLINTIVASFMALFWSIFLLAIVMLMAALFLCQSVMGTLEEGPHAEAPAKEWVFNMYGTSTRSLYTVFELTFSGCWPNYARRLVEDISPVYAAFFGVYIITVTFAMFRIISALFLRDTLAVASSDAELAVQERMKNREAYAERLIDFFHAADSSNDGLLTLEEFEAFLLDDKVKTWLSIMEIDVHETKEFFEILADGDDLISPDEFVQGILRLKGGARSQDVLAIQRTNTLMMKRLHVLTKTITKLGTEVVKTRRLVAGGAAD